MYNVLNQLIPRLENRYILIIFLIKYYQKIEKVKLEKNDGSKSSLLFHWSEHSGHERNERKQKTYAHAQLYVIEI